VLQAQGLSIEAGGRLLLADASFTVMPRDKVGIVGRNGAGKTTLFKVLGGTLEPAAGSSAPPSTLNKVVLPAPLRPTIPTLSRGMTVKVAPATTSRPPTSTESACAWSIRSGYGRGRGEPASL